MRTPPNMRTPPGLGAAPRETRQCGLHNPYNSSASHAQALTAFLHYRGHGRFDASFKGQRLVVNSRDPECALARELLALGHTGLVSVCDGKTGAPRSQFDIERLAQYRCVETANAPRFRKLACAETAPAAQPALSDAEPPSIERRAAA